MPDRRSNKTNLHSKAALVADSTNNISLGITKVLAQAGTRVILNGFGGNSHAQAEVATLDKIPDYHDANLRGVRQIGAMIHHARSTSSGVNIVANNAGIQHVTPVE